MNARTTPLLDFVKQNLLLVSTGSHERSYVRMYLPHNTHESQLHSTPAISWARPVRRLDHLTIQHPANQAVAKRQPLPWHPIQRQKKTD